MDSSAPEMDSYNQDVNRGSYKHTWLYIHTDTGDGCGTYILKEKTDMHMVASEVGLECATLCYNSPLECDNFWVSTKIVRSTNHTTFF